MHLPLSLNYNSLVEEVNCIFSIMIILFANSQVIFEIDCCIRTAESVTNTMICLRRIAL